MLLMHFPTFLLKTAVALAAVLAGALAGFVADADPGASSWYYSPTFTAAWVTGLFLLCSKALDIYSKRKDTNDDRHMTLSDKTLDLTHRERAELLDGIKELHEQELDFMRSQAIASRVDAYEAKIRAQRYRMEMQRAQTYISKIGPALGLEAFQPAAYEDLMQGVAEEVEAFRAQLEKAVVKPTGMADL